LWWKFLAIFGPPYPHPKKEKIILEKKVFFVPVKTCVFATKDCHFCEIK
jgi:hypothetical protein